MRFKTKQKLMKAFAIMILLFIVATFAAVGYWAVVG